LFSESCKRWFTTHLERAPQAITATPIFFTSDIYKKILLLNASSEYINILSDNNISYTLVFPEESLKSVYIDKVKNVITEEELNEFEKTFTDNVLRLKQDTKNVHIILSNPEDTIEGVLKEFNILNED
jgi:hypothetical protein